MRLVPELPTSVHRFDWLGVALSGFLAPSRIAVAMTCVGLAQRALDRAPLEGRIWNTLGVAHYRAGDTDRNADWVGSQATTSTIRSVLPA